MDFVKDAAAGLALLTVQLVGPFADVLSVLPIPHTPQAWGECVAWFVIYLLARLRDRRRVIRRVRAGVKRIKATLPPCDDPAPAI